MDISSALVSLKGVDYNVDGKLLLSNITFDIAPKQTITIIGPNGAGKTTLLKIILGIIQPTKGMIQRIKGLRVGYCPQKIHFNPFLQISVDGFLRTLSKPQSFEQFVAVTRIAHLLATPLHQLSGGEMQRVLLCRALLQKPNMLVLDEPTQGMDITAQQQFYHLLQSISDYMDCAVVMVSHDLNYVSDITEHVICLNQHICCQGVPSAVSGHDEYIKIFGVTQKMPFKHYAHQHDHTHDAPCHEKEL